MDYGFLMAGVGRNSYSNDEIGYKVIFKIADRYFFQKYKQPFLKQILIVMMMKIGK